MPLNKEAYIRYKIIDECIGNRFHPYPAIKNNIGSYVPIIGEKFSVSSIKKITKSFLGSPSHVNICL